MFLPEKFLARMERLLGDAYNLFLEATAQKAVRAMRVNSIKRMSAEKLSLYFDKLDWLSYAKDGAIFDMEHIGRHPLHHAGAFYVQDPGAMATVHAAPVRKGWRVADFCAAPGGKSSQLASYIGDEGVLVSNEIDGARCKVLTGNFERLGVSNSIVTNTDSATLAKWYPSYFDLVLVDAPCSGEGMFRKYDYAGDEWSEENVLGCAARQKEILSNAAKTVRPDGFLLYSTCTFSVEENEMTVDAFLTHHPEFSVCSVNEALVLVTQAGVSFDGCEHLSDIPKMRRFYPHVSKGEGQFICLMKRKGETENEEKGIPDFSVFPKREEAACASTFLRDTLEDADGLLARYALIKHKNYLVLKRKDIPLPPEHVYMAGVTLGEVVKGRLEPHHQFFSVFGHLCKRRMELDAQGTEVLRYLRGETLPCNLPNGYGAVTVCGCPLGGIKVTQGVAKNHYPKGLRLKGDL